jgi:hypothetical protein
MNLSITYHRVFAIILFVFIAGTSIFNVFYKGDIVNIENRKKHPIPNCTLKTLEQFPTQFDLYFNDNFMNRDNAILNVNNFKFNKMGINTNSKDVVVGKKKWLFGAEYLKRQPVDFKRLNLELLKRQEWCLKRDALLATIIVPSKGKVYTENLYNNFSNYVNGDTLLNYNLKKFRNLNPTIHVIDLKRTLSVEKSNTYYPQDSHWNSYGAFLGYNKLLNEWDLENLEMDALDSVKIKSEQNLKELLGVSKDNTFNSTALKPKIESETLRSWLKSESISKKPNSTNLIYGNVKNGKKIIVVCDSFGRDFVPFMIHNFEEILVVHDNWTYSFNEAILKKFKPNYVLYVVYEKRINNLIENAPAIN